MDCTTFYITILITCIVGVAIMNIAGIWILMQVGRVAERSIKQLCQKLEEIEK